MFWDVNRVWNNVMQAETEDLLDRVTVYRGAMEPEALRIITAELRERGVSAEQVAAHAAARAEFDYLCWPDGIPQRCHACTRPAVVQLWGWHWLWGRVPVFPCRRRYCVTHRPGE
jgi:ATP-dependent helicase YprA (DUF1998 family)